MRSTHQEVFRRAFRFELQPTRAQSEALERMAHARRFAYNWALGRWQEYHRETGGRISFKHLSRELTQLKREPHRSWLQEVDSQLLQQALFDVQRAYVNFFERRTRYPRFRSRKRDPLRFRIPQRVRVSGTRVYVPKIGWVRLRLSREVTGVPKSATFKRDAAGKWFVAVVTEFERTPSGSRASQCAVGIDLGISEFAVLSDGRRIQRPEFANLNARKLRQAHRSLSRKQTASRNRDKARRRLARVYRRASNRRRDFLHKLSTGLIEEYDLICIEDLGVDGLARTKLARKVYDAGFREFRRQLEYKAHWSGRRVVLINRFFPSTKTCSACGSKNAGLQVHERHWTCGCGSLNDRDLNAARNLLTEGRRILVAAGHADTQNACRASMRLPTGAAGVEAGISG